MEKLKAVCRIFFLLTIILLAVTACNNKKSIPFPTVESAFTQPISRPFTFSEPQPLKWKDISSDSIKPPVSVQFDIDKLPAKPFTVNDFKTFKKPIEQRKLDWNNLKETPFNLDTIKETPLKLQKSILPKPAIVRAGLPKLLSNTTSGLLQFGEEEGLPGSMVTASLIDKNGMIWLASNNGLCRYTGEHLFVYSFVNKGAQGYNYSITHLTEDHEGRIWAVTAGDGIYILDTDNGILLHDSSNIFGTDIMCDDKGLIWAATLVNGIYLIDTKKWTVKNIRRYAETKKENSVLAIKEDHQKNIWISNDDNLSILDSSRHVIRIITAEDGLISNRAIEFFEDSEHNMWTGYIERGINFISLKNKTISTVHTENGFNNSGIEITEDNRGQMWIAEKDTFSVINKQRTAIKDIVTNAKMAMLVKGTSIKDKQGNIWFGTTDKGIILIDTKGPLPEHLDNQNGLTDNNIWGLMEDKNENIWIGTRNGINIYNPRNSELRWMFPGQGFANNSVRRIMQYNDNEIFISTIFGFSILNLEKKILTSYGKDQNISNYLLQDGIKDNLNRLWISSVKGIVLYNIEENSIKILDKSTGLLSDIIWDITSDNQGNIWLGSDSGLMVINPVSNTIKYLRETDGLCNNIVQKIVFSNNGEIWVATRKGISLIDPYKNTITNLTAKEGLVPETQYDLVEQNGKFYAGSENGLIVITKPDSLNGGTNNNQWNFTNYGKKQGFPYNDYNQNTAITTKNGQSWWGVAPVLTINTQLPVADTIASNIFISRINIMDEPASFSSYSTLKKKLSETDTLWDESKKKYYLKNTLPQDSGYLVNNNIQWDSISTVFKLPVGLSLPYNQNSLNFSFTNNDIKGRDKIVYRYILEGADEKWSPVSDRFFSKNYYNLSPGSYTFKVSTKGFSGLWSQPAELSFTVRPPWWQTWWAYLLYIVAAGFIITAFAKYRLRRLQLKNIDLENKINKRTAELSKSLENLQATQAQLVQSEKMASLGELTAGIAHEIQNPLNFVNNFSEVNTELIDEMEQEIEKGNMEEVKILAKDIKENEQKINHHGKRAETIVKGMLQHSRSSNGIKEATDINELADEYLRLAYHGLRAKDKTFNATMKTDFDETLKHINIVPQDIGRVILNLINNAFYAVKPPNPTKGEHYKPTVSVTTKRIGDNVLIKVADNGNGIPQKIVDKIFQPFFTTKPTGQGTGLGLSLSYDIIKAHGGDLKVETKEGEGATFIIQLPV